MVSHVASSNQVGEGRWNVFSQWARICFEDRRSRSQPAGVESLGDPILAIGGQMLNHLQDGQSLRASILANRERY